MFRRILERFGFGRRTADGSREGVAGELKDCSPDGGWERQPSSLDGGLEPARRPWIAPLPSDLPLLAPPSWTKARHWREVDGVPVKTVESISKLFGREPTVEEAADLVNRLRVTRANMRPFLNVVDVAGEPEKHGERWSFRIEGFGHRHGFCAGVLEDGTPVFLDVDGVRLGEKPCILSLPLEDLLWRKGALDWVSRRGLSVPPNPARQWISETYRAEIAAMVDGSLAVVRSHQASPKAWGHLERWNASEERPWTFHDLVDLNEHRRDFCDAPTSNWYSDGEFLDYDLPFDRKLLVKVHGLCGLLMKDAHKRYRPAILWALRQIRANLDPEAVRICRRARIYTHEFYRFWVAGGDKEKQKARIQASDAYPPLTHMFYEDKSLTEVIDGKGSLSKALVGKGISKGHQRRLAALPYTRVVRSHDHDSSGLLEIFSKVSPERFPEKPWEWRLATALTRYEQQGFGCELRDRVAGELLGSGMSWKKIADVLDVPPSPKFNGRTPVLQGLNDSIQAFVDQCIRVPVALQLAENEHRPTAKSLVGTSRRITFPVTDLLPAAPSLRLISFSKEWHADGHRFRHAARCASQDILPEVGWLPLVPGTLTAPNGCLVAFLTDRRELRDEGKAMHHCVGGYSSSCRTAESHVASIRSDSGERLSTLEIRAERHGGGWMFREAQNQGVGNGKPPAAAETAAAWLLSEIQSGRLPTQIDDCRATYEEREELWQASQLKRDIEDLLGFSPSSPADLLPIIAEWHRIAPKQYRPILDASAALCRGEINVPEAVRRMGIQNHALDSLVRSLSEERDAIAA